MPEDKIVHFPGAHFASPKTVPRGVVHQGSLFGHTGDNRGKVVFLDIRWLHEEALLNLITRNGVKALVDLRSRPVFERPRFRHRVVVNYFYEHDISYLEYAILSRWDGNLRGRTDSSPGTEARIRQMLLRGLMIFLYEREAGSATWVEAVRQLVRSAPEYIAEMHPRALAAAPETASPR